MDIKLSKAKLSKVIQSGEFIGALLDRFVVPLMKVGILLAKTIFAPLATMASASEIYGVIQRKMHGRSVARARKGITLVFLNEDLVLLES